EMDDEDCERRRMECLDEMSNLEKQFTDLKDQLYKERLSQVDAKLQEVIAGKAPEYLEPLAALQENMQIRTKVAGIYRELCLESVKNKYECEIQASRQHCELSCIVVPKTAPSTRGEATPVQSRAGQSSPLPGNAVPDAPQDRVGPPGCRALLAQIQLSVNQNPQVPFCGAALQPLIPQSAMATLGPHRVKPEPPVKLEKHLHSARSEEGRLYYDGEWYGRGQTICIDKKDECPTSAIITTINHDEVWFKRPDGSKSKLYISQLQKGKYSIKHNHN
ncbi:BRM1L protein, partial [Promerops cafer]|nr:BRM1L protein [Promerops cafer]